MHKVNYSSVCHNIDALSYPASKAWKSCFCRIYIQMSYNWLFHADTTVFKRIDTRLRNSFTSTKIENIEALSETSESGVNMK